jgi:hypothetical protein
LTFQGAFVITKSMEQSPSWEADSRSAAQEIICLVWTRKVHYCVHNIPQVDPILSQMNPIYTFSQFKSHFNIIHHSIPSLPSGLFPSGFQTKLLYVCMYVCIFHCALHVSPLSPSHNASFSSVLYFTSLILCSVLCRLSPQSVFFPSEW